MRFSKKIESLETTRGIVCVLLVFFHVVGSTSDVGLKLPPEHVLRFINWFLQDLRMPLFSYLSGFVFLSAATTMDQYSNSILKKFRRLVVPFFTASTISYIGRSCTDGNEVSYLHILFYAYEHYWYIQATVVLMFIHLTITLMTGGKSIETAAISMVVGVAIYIFGCDYLPDILSVDKAAYLSPYFFAGYLSAHMFRGWIISERDMTKIVIGSFATVLTALILWEQFVIRIGFTHINDMLIRLLRIIAGILTCLSFVSWSFKSRSLSWIGGYSYVIFLYHVMFSSLARRLAMKLLHIENIYILTVSGLLLGIGGPIVIQTMILRLPYLPIAVLGIHRNIREERELKLAVSASFSASDIR